MTWTTRTNYVDIETGEALTENHIKKGQYIKLTVETKYQKTSKDYGFKYNTWKCEKNRQTRLEL